MENHDLEAATDIMNNPANPKHKLYLQNDPAVVAEVNRAYQKKYPTTATKNKGMIDVSGVSITRDGIQKEIEI